nr:MAG TPA: hypothetical protein [Caudoviricetes sp.]
MKDVLFLVFRHCLHDTSNNVSQGQNLGVSNIIRIIHSFLPVLLSLAI